MSIEVEKTEPAVAEPLVATPALLPRQRERPPLWRRRWVQIASVVLVLALIAAYVANNYLARQYSPDGAVRQYLAALQSGDAKTAWSVAQVAAPSQPTAASLVNETAMSAALASAKPDIRGYSITGTTEINSSTDGVDFVYDTGTGAKPGKFILQRSGDNHVLLYPSWHVLITPTLLQIDLPKGSAGIVIDGQKVAVPDGKSILAVLPLSHKIQFASTNLLAAQTLNVDDFFTSGSVLPYHPQLSSAGVATAAAAVKAYFVACAQQSDIAPANCPQSSNNDFATAVKWQLFGDPTADLAMSFDGNMNLVGVGHFQMVIAYQESGLTGTAHDLSAGGYSVALVPGSSGVTVASITASDNVAPVQRPAAATDQAALAPISRALTACASVRALAPADCPQRLSSVVAANVSWKVSGDPTTGAVVAFDPKTGIYTVHGQFNMTASYTINGYPSSDASYYDHYYAQLLWDGQAFQLVTMAGGFS
jgi:hypothetical protein